jgi:peptide/nickel transport system permease protein
MSEAQVIAASDAELGIVPSAKPRGMVSRSWEVFAENKLALAGLGFIVFILLFCFVGPHIYVTNQTDTDLTSYLCTPSGSHLLGCNDLGYDELGRLMAGGQTSLEVGLLSAIVSCFFGALYGAISGFAGGFVDAVMMRIVDAGLSLPSLMVIIILSVIFHPTPLVIVFIISVFYWFGVARLVRGETLSLRTREYIDASRAMGGRGPRIIARHLIPNAFGTIVVSATFQVADAIILLATLSFLGFGLPPPAATWGGMLSQGTTYLLDGYWWEVYPAGLIIMLTVIAFNFAGDALRDSLDARLRPP